MRVGSDRLHVCIGPMVFEYYLRIVTPMRSIFCSIVRLTDFLLVSV